MKVLAVDPGREKSGVAVCGPDGVAARKVVALADLIDLVRRWAAAYQVDVVLVGDQTGSKHVFDMLAGLSVPVRPVAERWSTFLARGRYFRDHPPRGWRRFIPLGLQVPPEPYDDYAAVVLAEGYLQKGLTLPGKDG
ncbi:MAG TPA: hypothetical protein VJT32_11365 [bacterium]|nr:hypothetical protein [bacterium]